MSKDEIIAAIRKCAKELGRCPSLGEILKHERVSRRQVRRAFGNYAMAVRASGMEPPRGAPVALEALFQDWAGVVRKLKKLPTIFEYERESVYSAKPLISRFKGWRGVAPMMLAYLEREGLEGEWQDVAEAIRADRRASSPMGTSFGPGFSAAEAARGTGRILKDRPTFGPPMTQSGMLCGPENENGVLVLFGMWAWRLGFAIKKVQTAFPDIIALRKIDEQTWQEVRIEAEQESRNFVKHGHSPSGADLLVCWIHNWPECPIEVIELSKVEG
ncbi:MAG TPA: hypothetical protein VFR84_07315 [Candidatus Angelobacter sp.]|nr:hypothetical protein [Candidatus Angelobacter sp.]